MLCSRLPTLPWRCGGFSAGHLPRARRLCAWCRCQRLRGAFVAWQLVALHCQEVLAIKTWQRVRWLVGLGASHAEWQSPHGAAANASTQGRHDTATPAAAPCSFKQSVRMLATVSDIMPAIRSTNGVMPEAPTRTSRADTRWASRARLLIPNSTRTCKQPKLREAARGSSAGQRARPRRAGGPARFSGCPWCSSAKEQLSSAQRAARRTPYSKKLKNEAQRERNRCARLQGQFERCHLGAYTGPLCGVRDGAQ